MRNRRRRPEVNNQPSDACAGSMPESFKYPKDQLGKRLTPKQLRDSVERGDRDKASQEGQYAIEKLVWLRSDEQRDRPDRVAREKSATGTIVLTHEYTRKDIEAGRKTREGGKRAAVAKHGEPERRQIRYEQMQTAIDDAARRYPNEDFRRWAARVALKFGCHERTVRKHTRNPRPSGK